MNFRISTIIYFKGTAYVHTLVWHRSCLWFGKGSMAKVQCRAIDVKNIVFDILTSAIASNFLYIIFIYVFLNLIDSSTTNSIISQQQLNLGQHFFLFMLSKINHHTTSIHWLFQLAWLAVRLVHLVQLVTLAPQDTRLRLHAKVSDDLEIKID